MKQIFCFFFNVFVLIRSAKMKKKEEVKKERIKDKIRQDVFVCVRVRVCV